METLKVRQIVFNFDKKSEYRYDVNQTIKILDLKRMIETALQIPRYRVKLYHNNIDYTSNDDSRIEALFPDLQLIFFNVALEPNLSNEAGQKEISIKLKLGNFCEDHPYKYPCHFCFDCNRSFCSICNRENIHSEHETIEKYDYLQDTNIIVNKIFCKVTEEIKSLKFENEENVEKFEIYLKEELFNKLRDLINDIENKVKNILNVYLESSKNSLKQIENNLNSIKVNCSDALNSKKEELNMQNMLIDESVIISYYNTILQIHHQKQPIEQDKKKFLELVESLSIVQPLAENIFNEIKGFLLNKLESDTFTKCENEINKNKISAVNLDNIKDRLHTDIMNSTSKKPMANARAAILGMSPQEFSVFNSEIKNKFHHLDDSYYLKSEIKKDENLISEKKDNLNLNVGMNFKNINKGTDQGFNKLPNVPEVEQNIMDIDEEIERPETKENAEYISSSIKNTGKI